VAPIAAEVHLSIRLVLFLTGSAAVGKLVGVGSRRATASAVLLTTSIRDFAIAASLATSAFGTRAAAPLGLYGIIVLVWGTAAAGALQRRGRGGESTALVLRGSELSPNQYR